MKILVIDTTDINLIVTLIVNQATYTHESQSQLKKHNSTLLPAVEELLEQASIGLSDLDALACVCGPGSFTGIRLGVTTVNGLARGLGKPIISLNALEVIAYGCKNRCLAMVDANHGNYYVGIYNDNQCLSLENYDTQQLESFTGEKLVRDDKYVQKLIDVTKQKYKNANFGVQLTPLYMKLSQAEREKDGNN